MGNTPSSQASASPVRRKLYKPRSMKNASAADLRSASCVSVPASSRSCDPYLASSSQPSFRSRPPSTRSRRHQVSEPEPVPPLPRAHSWHSRLQPRRRQSNASSSHFDTPPVLDPSLFTQPRPAVLFDDAASSPYSPADLPSSISSPPPHDHVFADLRRPASSGGAVAGTQGSASPDSSMCIPMRRRSLVLTPGLATRFLAQEMPPPLPSPMPPAMAAAPVHPTRPPPMPPLDTVRALALGSQSTANSDTWERSATPCDTSYRQLGAIKFGSLRIANGSPDLSPAGDHDDEFPQLPPPAQARPSISASPLGQEPATAVVLDDAGGPAKRAPCDWAKSPTVEAYHAATTPEPNSRALSIGLDTTASERASNLTPSPGPDPGPGPSSNPPPPDLVTVTGSSRYDNGLPSPASSASDGSPEASSKADSGYASNNSSVRSVRRHATSYPDQPRRRPPPPPGLLPQRTLLKPIITVTPLTIPPQHQFDRPSPSSRPSFLALSRDKFRRLSTLAGTRSHLSSPTHLSDYSILPGVGLETNLPPPRRPSTSYLGSAATSRSKGMQERLQRLLRGHKKQPFRPAPYSPMDRMTPDQEPVLHRYRPLSSYDFPSTSSHPFGYSGREESRLRACCMSSLQLPTASASGPESFPAAPWSRQRHSYHGGATADVLATTPRAPTKRLLPSASFTSRPLSECHLSGPEGHQLRPSTSGGEYDAVTPTPTAVRDAGPLELEAKDYFSLPAPALAGSQLRVRYQPWPGPAETQTDPSSSDYPRRPPPYRRHLARRSMVDSASLSSRPWRSELNLHEPTAEASSSLRPPPPPVSLQIGRPKGLNRLSSLPPPSTISRLGSPRQHDDGGLGSRASLNHRRRPSLRQSVAVPETLPQPVTATPRNRHSYAGPALNYEDGARPAARPSHPPSSLLAYRQPLNSAYKTIDPRRHSYSRDFPYRALRGFV